MTQNPYSWWHQGRAKTSTLLPVRGQSLAAHEPQIAHNPYCHSRTDFKVSLQWLRALPIELPLTLTSTCPLAFHCPTGHTTKQILCTKSEPSFTNYKAVCHCYQAVAPAQGSLPQTEQRMTEDKDFGNVHISFSTSRNTSKTTIHYS